MTTQSSLLPGIIKLFRYYKQLGEKSFTGLDAPQLQFQPGPEDNSIAIIVKHLSGNMLSRWTDFLTSDGEKSWRNRDDEFVNDLSTPEEVAEAWEKGWKVLFDAIEPLTEADLSRIVYIRNEGHEVIEAIHRQLAHYAYHVGQLVFLAKMIKGTSWTSLSIPKRDSVNYNKEKFSGEKAIRHFTDKA